MYGGRGGAKSWGVARALLIQGAERPLRILCARELQTSIKESVHHLLESQIDELNLSNNYDVLKSEINGINGTQFVFAGLKNNAAQIKSFEGVDRVWVEEAQTVSRESWKYLIPTIRKDGSEIWVTFNPELESDETYQRFVIHPPTDSVVRKINWRDNKWFNDVLNQERLDDLRQRPDEYRNVWEGECMSALQGAIYAKELQKAEDEERIGRVLYDALKPVHTFFDLGWADETSIWFAQTVGSEYRLIDFYTNRQMPIQHYVQVMQSKEYVYGRDWLPHDAKAKSLQSGRSIEEIMTSMGRNVVITPNLSLNDGINAARTIFNRCFFDKEKCADGLQALRHYRYEVDKDTKELSRKPLHDWSSHAADAFRYFAISVADESPARRQQKLKAVGWRA